MFYPANPVHFKARTQVKGLKQGQFILMPKWDGRRAVKDKTGLWYKSGKPCDARPWRDLPIPECPYPLDLELMRDRAIVLDIIVPNKTLEQRFSMAQSLGLEIMYYRVNTVNQVKEYFRRCRQSGICDGVVLKRLNSRYMMCQTGQLDCRDWVKMKDESIHLLG
jgi:hypothetical protein